MTVVAVTRQGWGDAWLFESIQEADLHPLIQYGDAILAGPEDITRKYNMVELPRFLAELGDEDLRVAILSAVHPEKGLPDRVRLERVAEHAEAIWSRLVASAQSVPDDHTEVFNQIVSDRKETIMAAKKPAETTTTTATTKPAAPAKTPKAPKYGEGQKITMLADKDGKKYGKDNNPKRAGSKAAENFAKMSEGLTIAAYVKAVGAQGPAFAELDYNIAHNFVKVA